MNDQLGLLLRRERLWQNDRCGRLSSSLKELSDLNASWTIFCVVIVTTDKERKSRFKIILIISRLCLGFIRLWIIIYIILIIILSFFSFIFFGRGGLNIVNLRSFFGRSRSRALWTLEAVYLGLVWVVNMDLASMWKVLITPSTTWEFARVVEVAVVEGQGASESKS
jgi:hypothetical protein